MKVRYGISVLFVGVLFFAFQNCSAPKNFEQTSQLSSASVTATSLEQDSKPVVTCSSFNADGEVQLCLEYNNHTNEQYGVNNCTNPQYRKAFVPCERDNSLIGRCRSYNNLGDIFTYKYAPSYADEALRAIIESEAIESCKYSGTWEKAGTF